MKKEKAICNRCAKKLEKNADLVPLPSRVDEKVDCAICCRHRFGRRYKVGDRRASDAEVRRYD